jgi:hypothetical protein
VTAFAGVTWLAKTKLAEEVAKRPAGERSLEAAGVESKRPISRNPVMALDFWP